MNQRVVPDPETPGAWYVRIGSTDQSWVDPDHPTRLEFDYVQQLAAHLDAHAPAGERLRVIHVGGGGLTLPRYVAHTRPTSAQIVLEPDEALTDEVRATIPLPRNSGIKVRPQDGRTGLAAMPDAYADVVIIDAFDGARVPGGLATIECFAEVRRVLTPTGALLMNVTDGRTLDWTRRTVSGLGRYFPHVIVGAESSTLKGRRFGNLVLAASRVEFPLDVLTRRAAGAAFPYRLVHGDALARLIGGAQPHFDPGEPSPLPPFGAGVYA
ncbi:MAG TPA: fused MFS/spermidine synthase [Propionibacteriaceae bacterium]|nr:fused MFS/spermidine synthase [Propionibacteriaceae bacterium]